MRNYIKQVLLLVGVLMFTSSFSQDSGWDFMRQNKHVEAKKSFKERLVKDSLDADAIVGLMFLSEIEGDVRTKEKLQNRYAAHVDDPYFFFLFGNYYVSKKEDLNKRKFPSWIKNPILHTYGETAFEKRRFDEAKNVWKSVASVWNWSMIGPFPSQGGIGHITDHPIEKLPFDPNAKYQNQFGGKITWVTPPHTLTDGAINFSYHLNSLRGGNVYYANTFIKVPKKETVQLRIKRSSPIKIWVDQSLVFDNADNISARMDNEFVQFDIEAGTHRILIKSSEYFPFTGKSASTFQRSITDEWEEDSWASDDESIYIRLTNVDGDLVPGVASETTGNFQPVAYPTTTGGFYSLNYYKDKVQSEPTVWKWYYLLSKAYLMSGYSFQGEEWIATYLKNNPNAPVFIKYLAYLHFDDNNKNTRAQEWLKGVDQESTPIFDVIYQKFKELDIKNDEEKWLDSWQTLHEISPSNRKIIRAYINYCEKFNKKDDKEKFIKDKIKEYPDYKYFLEEELKSSNKPDEYIFGDKDRKKDLKNNLQSIKKNFYESDYSNLIDHYKNNSQESKVLELYNEWISIQPYDQSLYIEKAEYLYQKEKYDEAIAILNQAMKLAPSTAQVQEMLGDIHDDLGKKSEALVYYRQAILFEGPDSGIWDKIEKNQGQSKNKSLFTTNTFEEIIRQKSTWEPMFKDKDAVVLYYASDMLIDTLLHIEAFSKLMVQINTEAGARAWTEAQVNQLGYLTSVKVIKSDSTEIRPDVRGGMVVCKNLSAGDRIEIEGYVNTHYRGGNIEDEITRFIYYSFKSPVYKAKLEVATAKGVQAFTLFNRLSAPVDSSSKDRWKLQRWEFENIPELIDETANDDELDKYSFAMLSTMKDWSKVVDWYRAKTYRVLEPNYVVTSILDTLIRPGMSNKQKVEAIYNYVTGQINYSHVSFLQSSYIPKPTDVTCDARIGDCKDVSTLMISMLRQVGIPAWYVLVKSSHASQVDLLPIVYFDHVLVAYELDGKIYYSDPVTDFFPYDVVCSIDFGSVGLLIKEGVTDVFRLPLDNLDPLKSMSDFEVKAVVSSDRKVDIHIKATYAGTAGGRIREMFNNFSESEKKNYILERFGKGIFDHLEIKEYSFKNLKEMDKPLNADFHFVAYNHVEKVLDMLLCKIPTAAAITYDPSISSSKRYSTLDLSKITDVEPVRQKVEIVFPQGWYLVQKPDNVSIKSKFGQYSLLFQLSGNTLIATKSQQFSKQLIPSNDFDGFKKYYQELLDADATTIVLKKK